MYVIHLAEKLSVTFKYVRKIYNRASHVKQNIVKTLKTYSDFNSLAI